MTDRNRTLPALAVVLGLVMVVPAGCGSSSTDKAQGGPAACPPILAVGSPASPLLASALRLSAVIHVSEPRSEHPKCFSLTPGSTVSLQVGDIVEFEANAAPNLTPNGSTVVTVSTRPGPTSSGPGDIGGLQTAHLIIDLAAVSPGSVTVGWIDCSGTGC